MTPTSANFIAQALRTGLEAIGRHAYTGTRWKPWTIDDLKNFARNLNLAGTKPDVPDRFDAVLPNPYYDGNDAKKEGNLKTHDDTRKIDHIKSERESVPRRFINPKKNTLEVRTLSSGPVSDNVSKFKFAYEEELQYLPTDFRWRVSYGFRGDTRKPEDIKKGQFMPNFTRTSHTDMTYKKLHEINAPVSPMNLPRFLKQPFLGEFISTSKSVAIARYFATCDSPPGGSQIGYQNKGWVYACFVEGAIEIPAKGDYMKDGTTYSVPHNEQELALPGMLEWEDVVACREVKESGEFTGPIYIRTLLQDTDRSAALDIYDLLSGKSQGDIK
jgi:hypothetical protein